MREHLDDKQQRQLAFFLTGRCEQPMLEPLNDRYRPALFASYADLTSLRYDFPIVLNENGAGDRAVLSLSALVDEAVATLPIDRDRVARHGHRIEHKIRQDLKTQGSVSFELIWKAATGSLANDDETIVSSANSLWDAFDVSGRIVDADADLPCHVVRHAWRVVARQKARDFKQKTERILLKLRDILVAEECGSKAGRAPERLRTGVGTAFSDTFDFKTLSRILDEARPDSRLSDKRRQRIQGLIDVIEGQLFYATTDGKDAFGFEFQTCREALVAYNDRYNDAVKLLKALAVAELEVNGDYREDIHDVIFHGFGQNGLGHDQLAKLPDYLICTNTSDLDPVEISEIVEILAAGRPFRIIVTTHDVLERSKVGAAHMPLAFRTRQLVDTAIGLSDVFVFQAPASDLYRSRDPLMRAVSYDGPVLFSIFSGDNDFTSALPPYLVAAAAQEARVFPTMIYDPSAGDDLRSRLRIGSNPDAEADWPVHPFSFEDDGLQAHSLDLAFTLADLMAMDRRFSRHFAIVPDASWNDPLVSVPEALDLEPNGLRTDIPTILVVDGDGRLYRSLVDQRTVDLTRRSRTMWRLLRDQAVRASVALDNEAPLEVPPAEAAGDPDPCPEPTEPAEAVTSSSDEPYIETARCTTCNECTGINSKMFAYNGNKQAYIADPAAGTYRELVEAAESCQVSIIHPGKPRDPKEPGLEDLVKRAASFN